tara:strand:- start:2152 stop:2982 length:831 start_codon:yes stop_codon:yes gene_type:complete
MLENNIKKRDNINKSFNIIINVFSYFLLIPLILILAYIVKNGISNMNLDFFISLPKPVGEDGGGASNAIIGTFMIVFGASLLSIPIGVLIGLYLSEHQSKLSDIVRISIETLQGIPSIVYGIVAYAWVVLPFGTFSAMSASVALGLMILPMVTKATEETLKMIPDTLKEASYALGGSYLNTMLKVIIPAGFKGILSGILIGLARITGETAPLLFTAFGNPFMNINPLQPTNALPLMIYNYATSPYEEWQSIAWTASLFLILFVLSLSLMSKMVVKK